MLFRLEDFGRLPDPEEKGEKGGGMGELGKSLEFLMLKVAQLETLAEMQQVELAMHRAFIEDLQKKVDPDQAEASMMQQTSEDRVQEAHGILKKVVQKHAHQRQHREYHPEALKKQPKDAELEEAVEEGLASTSPPAPEKRSLLQRRNRDTAGAGRIIGKLIKGGADWIAKTGGNVYEGLTEEASRQVDNAVSRRGLPSRVRLKPLSQRPPAYRSCCEFCTAGPRNLRAKPKILKLSFVDSVNFP